MLFSFQKNEEEKNPNTDNSNASNGSWEGLTPSNV